MTLKNEFAQLKVERAPTQKGASQDGHRILEVITLRLETREKRTNKTLATLSPVALIGESKEQTTKLLPTDRARAWEELTKWIEYFVIFQEPSIQAKQHENRLKLEGAQFSLRAQPTEQELYDWRMDEPLLCKLRPRYASVTETMMETLGKPYREDFVQLYPNPYDDEDEGLSDQARWALRSLKAVFGKEILAR